MRYQALCSISDPRLHLICGENEAFADLPDHIRYNEGLMATRDNFRRMIECLHHSLNTCEALRPPHVRQAVLELVGLVYEREVPEIEAVLTLHGVRLKKQERAKRQAELEAAERMKSNDA